MKLKCHHYDITDVTFLRYSTTQKWCPILKQALQSP